MHINFAIEIWVNALDLVLRVWTQPYFFCGQSNLLFNKKGKFFFEMQCDTSSIALKNVIILEDIVVVVAHIDDLSSQILHINELKCIECCQSP